MHESSVRDEQSWDTMRGYILNNPIAWESKPLHLEKYNPDPICKGGARLPALFVSEIQ
jgi:hypothetical protein